MTETDHTPNPVLEELSQLRAKVAELEQRVAQAEACSSRMSQDVQLYQNLLENLPNGFIFVFDQDLRYLMVAGAGLHAPKETIEGKTLKETASSQNYELISSHYRLALQGQETSFELINFEGKTLLTRVRPLRDTQGNIFGGIAMVQNITEQKQAEEQLRQSETRYRTVSEMTSDFVWAASVTPQGEYKLEWATDALETITGYSLNELEAIGGWPSLLSAEDLQRMIIGLQQIYAGNLTDGEFRITRKDGQIRWLQFISRPLLSDTGQVKGIIGTSKDITEQKQAEEQLRRSEARYRAVSEMTSDFVWAASATASGQFKLDWVTDAVENVTGYPVAEFGELGGVGGICVREDLPVLLNMRQQVAKGAAKKAEFECRIICKNKEIRWLHVTGFPLLNNGQFSGLLAASKDVTEQKRTEEQLRQSEARYRHISEMTSDFVWVAHVTSSGQFEIDWITEAVESVTGYTSIEFAERNGLSGITVPEDLPLFLDLRQLFLEGKGRPVELDCRIIRKDKQLRWLHVVARITTDSTGQNQDIIVAAKDITERKQIEAERQALERQLQIVQKLESLGVLAGGLAHDFNNLLSVILGNLSLAQTTLGAITSDPEVISSLQAAEKASLRAISLTRQLLTFAKGGAPVRKTARLREILEDSARFMVSGSRATVDFKIEPDLAVAEVDTGQLSQVIQNLVLNAVQAMPDGGKIRLTARNITLRDREVATLPGGSYVQISVQDEGAGISPENLAKIFDPFFTTKELGSGLGLAMVFSIIRQHEGYIQAQSEPGEGTCFTFYLPASTSNQPLSKETISVPAQAGRASTGRILLMDDEPFIRQTVSRLLIHMGYSCEVAADGLEALQIYREAMANKCPFTAVILDLTVPNGMGGEETVRQILKNDPKARVIVSSGYSEDPIMANFRQYGFSGIASKPYRLEELKQVLVEVIGKP